MKGRYLTNTSSAPPCKGGEKVNIFSSLQYPPGVQSKMWNMISLKKGVQGNHTAETVGY